MKTKHTQGKWIIKDVHSEEQKKGSLIYCKICNEDKTIGFAGTYGGRYYQKISKEETKANAKLIAAAPEMLEALQIGLKLLHDCKFTNNDEPVDIIEKVIQKATK